MRSFTRCTFALWFAGAILASGMAVAGDGAPSQFQVAAIRAQQDGIRDAAMTRKGAFKDLGDAERDRLFEKQAVVEHLTRDIELTTELRESEQIELLNALEQIGAIVNKAEDERLVCRRERPIGSNRPVTTCRSVAQLRADREAIDADTGRRTLQCSEAAMGAGGCP